MKDDVTAFHRYMIAALDELKIKQAETSHVMTDLTVEVKRVSHLLETVSDKALQNEKKTTEFFEYVQLLKQSVHSDAETRASLVDASAQLIQCYSELVAVFDQLNHKVGDQQDKYKQALKQLLLQYDGDPGRVPEFIDEAGGTHEKHHDALTRLLSELEQVADQTRVQSVLPAYQQAANTQQTVEYKQLAKAVSEKLIQVIEQRRRLRSSADEVQPELPHQSDLKDIDLIVL